MTRAQSIAYRLRWLLLVLAILLMAAGIAYAVLPLFDMGAGIWFTPLTILSGDVWSMNYAGDLAIYLGLFIFTQWLFLRPRKGWTFSLTEPARPMKRAAVGAGFAMALLSAGLIGAMMEGIGKLKWDDVWGAPIFLWAAMVVLWTFWAIIFWVYRRQQDRYTRIGRVLRGLIVGSTLELFISAAVFVRQEDDCYCARVSYTGLVFGGTVLIWAFGPGVILLFLREKYRQQKLSPICPICGYDLRGSFEAGSPVCPECGNSAPDWLRQLHIAE